VEKYEKDQKSSKKRKERKSKLTWGPDKIEGELGGMHLDPELGLVDDVAGEGDDEGEPQPKSDRSFKSTFSKMLFGSSSVSSAISSASDDGDFQKGGSKEQKKKLAKTQSSRDWLSNLSFNASKKKKNLSAEEEDAKFEPPTDVLDALVDQAVGLVAPQTSTTAGVDDPNNTSVDTVGTQEEEDGTELVKVDYGQLPDSEVLCLTNKTSLRKRDILNLKSKGASHLRRNDFATLPGFEHGHHRHTENHLVNFDNDLLLAEKNGGLIRTFLEESGRMYDGHAASINELCFSHDER
jgi:hypothetical protein